MAMKIRDDSRKSVGSREAGARLPPISLFPIKQVRGGSVVKHISAPSGQNSLLSGIAARMTEST